MISIREKMMTEGTKDTPVMNWETFVMKIWLADNLFHDLNRYAL